METATLELAACRVRNRREAAAMVGISAKSWDRLVKSGRVPQPIRLGGRLVWLSDTLEKWLKEQSAAANAGVVSA